MVAQQPFRVVIHTVTKHKLAIASWVEERLVPSFAAIASQSITSVIVEPSSVVDIVIRATSDSQS